MSPEISAFAAKDLMEKTRRHDEAFWNIIVVSSGTVSLSHMDIEVPNTHPLLGEIELFSCRSSNTFLKYKKKLDRIWDASRT